MRVTFADCAAMQFLHGAMASSLVVARRSSSHDAYELHIHARHTTTPRLKTKLSAEPCRVAVKPGSSLVVVTYVSAAAEVFSLIDASLVITLVRCDHERR